MAVSSSSSSGSGISRSTTQTSSNGITATSVSGSPDQVSTLTVDVNGERREFNATSGILVAYGSDKFAAATLEECLAPEKELEITL